MEIVKSVLLDLGYILIFPGFLFCFLGGTVLSGIARRTAAELRKSGSPALIQPALDFFELCGKETGVPAPASRILVLLGPFVGLAALIAIQLLIPICSFTAFPGIADTLALLCLLAVPALAEIFMTVSADTPDAKARLRQQVTAMVSCALPLVLVLLAVGMVVSRETGSGMDFSLQNIAAWQEEAGCLLFRFSMVPAAAAFLLIIPGVTGMQSFDTAEIVDEAGNGGSAQISGIPLAVSSLSRSVRMLTMTSLFTAIFLGGLGTHVLIADGLITFFFCAVVAACAGVLTVVFAERLKTGKFFLFYWTVVSALAAISLVLAWYGL